MKVLLYLALSCPDVKVVNDSKLKWNKTDEDNLQYTKTQCVKIYPESPCLKLFIKRGFQNYWAICKGDK